ncbi:methyltransferase domain-containing protein [Candidatus Cyanaurora vandensis]|uniref:methyltransferase domain-containing protein n=1 Tax=Candidatus Cyanaurora vandensis TaxID=2714958 RepID=UPI00257A6BDE|nr:methyltransferase domain-containing protein [Candidatus Cyanaurora vandensis]
MNAQSWEARYQEGTDRWDLGQAAPPFVRLLASPDAPKPGRAVVLGCGRGYEALLFACHGFQVLGVDFAPSAITEARTQASRQGLAAEFLERDIFQLIPEYQSSFDYVVEHTCFCAIDPSQRSQYVALAQALLKPGGELLGLFITHDRPGGPPFGTAPQQLREYFSTFDLISLEPAPDSIPERQGEEYSGRFRQRRNFT